MMRILLGLLLSFGTVTALEGPDFMLINKIYVADNRHFSLVRQPADSYEFDLAAENAALYGVSSLKWNFFGVRFDYRAASFSLYYRTYGIEDLYDAPIISAFLQKKVRRAISLGLGVSHRDLRYGNTIYRTTDNRLLIGGGIKFAKIEVTGFIESSSVFSKNQNSEKTEALLAGSWQAQETLTISFSVYSDRRRHQRIALGQYLGLTDQLAINAGLLSDPEIFYAGFEFIYRGFILGYTYYETGGLPDCSKLTLAYR